MKRNRRVEVSVGIDSLERRSGGGRIALRVFDVG